MKGLKMKYFVLKPKGTDIYAYASRMAMRTYANIIIEENPELANDLLDWAYKENPTLPKEN
jgi:hypothetical protein